MLYCPRCLWGQVMGDIEETREARHLRVLAARSAGSSGVQGIPPPPYHVRDVQMLFITCRFKPEAVRAIVPLELTPAKSSWGVIAMYSVPSGWAIAPYAGFFMSLELEGLDSTDGSPGMYMHSGLYSGVGGEVMRTLYNRNFRAGWSRQGLREGRVLAEAGYDQTPVVRIEAEIGPDLTQLNGTSRYIGRSSSGGFNSYFISFALSSYEARPTKLEYLPGAEGIIHCIEPQEFVWPIYVPTASFSFSPPRLLGDASDHIDADTRSAGLVNLFARMGRSATIVEHNGTLVSLNAGAEQLIREGVIRLENGLLRAGGVGGRSLMEQMLASADRDKLKLISDRLVLSTSGGEPIIAQAISLDPGVAGPDKLLIFFDDPTRKLEINPAAALELLGLTPAEARIAGMVGAGDAPRAVAEHLDLSLNTVRSALKISFDKLGISRQSELARIVARLAG